MKRSNVLAAALGGLMLFAMLPARAIIIVGGPNATLPDGSPGFNLVGTAASLPAVQLPAVQLPAVQLLVGFNAVHPPSPNAPTLDLGDVNSPLITNLDTGSAFSIFWGMIDPGSINLTFRLPSLPPNPCSPGATNTPYCYAFDATDGTNTFNIALTIAGATALDATSWGRVNPGPISLPAVQFNFDFAGLSVAGDPTLSFTVTQNNNPLSFSVPEPASIALLGVGLLGLGLNRRKRTRKSAFRGTRR